MAFCPPTVFAGAIVKRERVGAVTVTVPVTETEFAVAVTVTGVAV